MSSTKCLRDAGIVKGLGIRGIEEKKTGEKWYARWSTWVDDRASTSSNNNVDGVVPGFKHLSSAKRWVITVGTRYPAGNHTLSLILPYRLARTPRLSVHVTLSGVCTIS